MNSNSFEVCSLASGSSGNSLYVGCSTGGILIDAGLSGAEICIRLDERNIAHEKIRAILLTHEHSDHIKGAGVLSRRFNVPILATEMTYNACRGLGKMKNFYFINRDVPFIIEEMQITPFAISHDAVDPVGFTLELGNKKIGFATDLGLVTEKIISSLRACDLLYIESNYDFEMLMNGAYPDYLKERISGVEGHLSNADTASLLYGIVHEKLKHVILAHLSEENNSVEKALESASQVLCHYGDGVTLQVAGADVPGEIIIL